MISRETVSVDRLIRSELERLSGRLAQFRNASGFDLGLFSWSQPGERPERENPGLSLSDTHGFLSCEIGAIAFYQSSLWRPAQPVLDEQGNTTCETMVGANGEPILFDGQQIEVPLLTDSEFRGVVLVENATHSDKYPFLDTMSGNHSESCLIPELRNLLDCFVEAGQAVQQSPQLLDSLWKDDPPIDTTDPLVLWLSAIVELSHRGELIGEQALPWVWWRWSAENRESKSQVCDQSDRTKTRFDVSRRATKLPKPIPASCQTIDWLLDRSSKPAEVYWKLHPFRSEMDHLSKDDPRRSGTFSADPNVLKTLGTPIKIPTLSPNETDLVILSRHYPDADPAKPPWDDIRTDLLAGGIHITTVQDATSRDLVRLLHRVTPLHDPNKSRKLGKREDSLPEIVRRLAHQVDSLLDHIVASFASTSAEDRIRQVTQATGEISVNAFPLITWIERNRSQSADLEKRRFFHLEDSAERCARFDIPEYAGGVIRQSTTDSPQMSSGLKSAAELKVFCVLFSKAILSWADEIETGQGGSTLKSVQQADESVSVSQSGDQMPSLLISYSHQDEEFAKHLWERLRKAGFKVWYADEDMRGGRKIHEQIDQAIKRHDRLLLILSEASMNSEWVETEIYKARQREIEEKKQIVFPIRLVDIQLIKDWKCFDSDQGRDMAREIREYFIPDFREWKDENKFADAFGRLVNDLKESSRSGVG